MCTYYLAVFVWLINDHKSCTIKILIISPSKPKLKIDPVK